MQTSTLESQSGHAARRADVDKIIIVADDLTGACDSGVAFLTSGRSVRVILDATAFNSDRAQQDHSESVLAITTETRHSTQEQATQRVIATLTPFLAQASSPLFFKKVDSAARGHFAAELVAALETSGAALALVAPAFPHAGRTVRDGILEIRDAAGQHTTIPLRPLFSEINDADIAVLTGGSEVAIEQALNAGVRILLCDAQSQEDLERLVAAAYPADQPILWAGSAGLARALASVLPASLAVAPEPIPRRAGRTVLFCGTDHPVTTLQVSHLREQADSPLHAIYRVDSQSQETIRDSFTAAPVTSLVLTGGDTAAFVLRALDASSIVLAGEISPGIPWGVIHGGLADGCVVVTKSGGFGEREALTRAFEFCDRRAL